MAAGEMRRKMLVDMHKRGGFSFTEILPFGIITVLTHMGTQEPWREISFTRRKDDGRINIKKKHPISG